MAEVNQTIQPQTRRRKVRHRGRLPQISIYFGKLMRMFVYQNDWKVLPMAALIAALVSMVVRRDFFLTMEGSLKGAFALTCVAIWNGCFNSIQVICRERSIIKREHRSGMHITSYVFSHMVYQALLCLAQTLLTLYVCSLMGVKFPTEGLFTPWLLLDLGITIFLITYASDMLSLWVSSLAHSTTTAMTVMPFVLIFQLVFSGGIFSLPQWCQSLSRYTISSYGINCIAAQSDYNSTPMVTPWNTLQKMKDNSVGGTITVGQALDLFSDDSKELVHKVRAVELGDIYTVGQAWDWLQKSESWKTIQAKEIDARTTLGEVLHFFQQNDALKSFRELTVFQTKVGDILNTVVTSAEEAEIMDNQIGGVYTLGSIMELLHVNEWMDALKNSHFGEKITIGEIVDRLASNPDVQKQRDKSITVEITVGQLIDLIGEDQAKTIITGKAAEASQIAAYDKNPENILNCWMHFIYFILAFAALSVLSLESIDRDKR